MFKEPTSVLKEYVGALSHRATRKQNVSRPAVTISRQSGAGALIVANLVARQLDLECRGDPPSPWAVFDRNLLTKILEDHDLSKRIEEFMPEDSRFPLSEAFEYLLGLHPPGWTLREYAKETIRKLATRGNVILIGRAGAIITANMRHVLHVRLIASFDFRVQNYAQFQGINAEEAARAVRANDNANHHFVRSYFNTNVGYHSHYDLVINTETNGFEGAAHVICAAVLCQLKRERTESAAI
ncbi:MAG: cytidylate kinase-like family protein [Chthoniobacterales bacterium]